MSIAVMSNPAPQAPSPGASHPATASAVVTALERLASKADSARLYETAYDLRLVTADLRRSPASRFHLTPSAAAEELAGHRARRAQYLQDETAAEMRAKHQDALGLLDEALALCGGAS